MLTFVSTIVVLGMLVFIHELGHFAVAKAVGIQVYEFSLGFGPKLIGFRKGETKYNLRAIPLGGFVRMAGMDSKEDETEAKADGVEVETIDPKRGFAAKNIFQRMSIIAAGPLMNFVLAIILLAGVFFLSGAPVVSTKIGSVLANTPAFTAGLITGDKILAVDNVKISQWGDLVNLIQNHPNQALDVLIERNNKQIKFTVTPNADPQTGVGIIGIKPTEPLMVKQGLFTSLKLGTEYTVRFTALIADVLGKMFTEELKTDQLGGPVRITMEIGKAAKSGLVNLTYLAAVLSINLGLFNLLPIPALDGSRILFLLFEGIRGKRVDPDKENMVHLVGLGLLLLLMVFVTFNDINQWLFKGRM